MKFLTEGKRGIVYLIEYNGLPAVIKEKRKESTAINTIENEARWLQVVNKHKIGPKFYEYSNGRLVMEYIEGEVFPEWLKKQTDQTLVRRVIRQILLQCYTLDQLKADKKEMHRPVKHIIIRNNKPVMIDFERCRKTLKPSNVTQFSQYLKKLDLIKFDTVVLQKYRSKMDRTNMNKVIALLTGSLL